jgi:hypothetical protein
LNWGKTEEELPKDISMESIATEAFLIAANFHAKFWKRSDLLENSWLRGTSWYRGEGEDTFRAAQNTAIEISDKI